MLNAKRIISAPRMIEIKYSVSVSSILESIFFFLVSVSDVCVVDFVESVFSVVGFVVMDFYGSRIFKDLTEFESDSASASPVNYDFPI